MTTEAALRSVVLLRLIRMLPDQVSKKLLDDPDVQSSMHLKDQLRIGDKSVDRDSLLTFLRAVEQKRPASLQVGKEQVNSGTLEADGGLVFESDGHRYRFGETGLFSLSRNRRELTLSNLCAEVTLPRSAEDYWKQRVREKPLKPADFIAIHKTAGSSAHGFREELHSKLSGGFSADDLVPTDPIYFESLFATPGTPAAYQQAVQEARAQAAERSTPAYLSHLAPMAVTPDFRIADATKTLAATDAALAVKRLLNDGDPFSLLAGFEIACARLNDPGFDELGRSALELLFGDGSETSAGIVHFTGVLTAAISILDWKGPLKAAPIGVRRLAAFLHASQVCRVFRDFNVTEPDFLELTHRHFAGRLQLITPLQRRSAPYWRLEWLQPQLIEAYLRRRCEEAISALPESERPSSWTQQLDVGEERLLKELLTIFALAAGPFDEFVAEWELPRHPSEFLLEVLAQIEAGAEKAVVGALFLAARASLDDAEKDRARTSLVRELSEYDGSAGPALYQASLALAAMWNDAELSAAAEEASFRHLLRDAGAVREVAQSIVAAAAIEDQDEAWAQRIAAGFNRMGFSVALGEPARTLLDVVDTLTALAPQLTKDLSKSRSAALLAA